MAPQLPSTMRAVALSHHCTPDEYALADLPVPQISLPNEILIRVRAASINPIDVKLAGSLGKMLMKAKFPYKIGFDLAGVIVAVGSGVKGLKVGDEAYSRTMEKYRGSVAQYALSTEETTCLKPTNLSFTEAAAVPLAATTALQCLDRGEAFLQNGLKGKTIFVPAALSGTGSFGVQLAKNCFGAGKVVTSLSPGKIERVGTLLGEGRPDVCVDYTKGDVVSEVGKGSVDFMLDTQSYSLSAMKVMKKGGQIVSISTVPNGTVMKKKLDEMPLWLELVMNLVDWVFRIWASWNGVTYGFLSLDPNARDLERLKGWVEEGKVKVIVGEVVKMSDIRGVRRGCEQILVGKGGVGKFVIEID